MPMPDPRSADGEPDPRVNDGELMVPALYPADRVAALKPELLRDYAAQFQQDPASETGAHFHRDWLPVRKVLPGGEPEARCRFWDLASTKQRPGTDPDWTVGALVSRWAGGHYSIDDVVRLRDTPGIVDKTILAVTQQDGKVVRVRIEQQIGTGGVFQADAYRKLLVGYDFAPVKPTGEKSTRWRPLSVQAEGENVWLAEAAWNDVFVREMCELPGRHDDQADAAAGAFNEIAVGRPARRVPMFAPEIPTPPDPAAIILG